MDDPQAEKKDIPPAALVVTAALLTLGSLFLLWFSIDTGRAEFNQDYRALDLSTLRLLAIGAGVLLLAFGAVQLSLASRGVGSVSGVGGLLVALALVALAGYCVAKPATALGGLGSGEVARDYQVTNGKSVATILEESEEEDSINVKPEIGSMLALGAGVLGVVGAALQLVRDRKMRRGVEGSRLGTSESTTIESTGGPMDKEPIKTEEPDQPPTPDKTADTQPRKLGSEGPGATGPGTPPVGGSSPADATGDTSPPPGTPPGGPNP